MVKNNKGEKRILEKILDIIYPPVCGICGKGKDTYLCKKCEIRLNKEEKFFAQEYDNKYFSRHYYMFRYGGIIRDLLLDYKFNEKPYLYRSFSKFIRKYQENYLKKDFYDIIIPVPISKKRYKIRGYNQSYLLAKELEKITNIKIEKNVLVKIRNNLAQSTLNKEQREKNVENMYEIMNNKNININSKNILIVDDIFTTGSTVNECAKKLVLNGARNVDVFTLAKD